LVTTEEARQRYWRDWLHTALTEKELAAVGRSVTSGRPYGPAAWVEQTAAQLGLDLVPRRRGRPRKMAEKMNWNQFFWAPIVFAEDQQCNLLLSAELDGAIALDGTKNVT
jgi:predicted RNA polymerase sigma factor